MVTTRTSPTPINEDQRKAWSGSEWRAIESVWTDKDGVLPVVHYDFEDYEITVDEPNETNSGT